MVPIIHIVAAFAAGLSGCAVIQSVAGMIAVRRFARRIGGAPRPAARPGITVLKPLHGDEPLLEQALESLCRQDYPLWQAVFGVQDPADDALAVVRRLQARFPDRDLAVVIDPTPHGANRKVANLINMLPTARHDVLVIADSDLHTSPRWLSQLAATLECPGVGLVTTAYSGLPACGPLPPPRSPNRRAWAVQALGAMQINQYFLPGALLARAMGRQDCLGATMMLRRETLERIGGFAALVDHLADDNVLGRLVQRLGLRVALAPTVPSTTVPEDKLRALWRHELRWARTIRALEPVQFAGSVLQYPLAWAAAAVLLAGAAPWALAWFAGAWAVRALVAHAVDRGLRLVPRSSLWLLPVRELMSVAVMVASYAGRRVDWRGHSLQAEGFNPR